MGYGSEGPEGHYGSLDLPLPNGTLPAGSVTNAMLASMPARTIKGNDGGALAAPQDLTVAEVQTLITMAVADLTALAALAVAGIPSGQSATVLDIGNGTQAIYTLRANVAAADGVLRVAANGDAARQWVAGDGYFLPVTYLSAKVDFAATPTGVVIVPAFTQAGWGFVNRGTTNRLLITDFAGTLSTNASGSMGNNASHNNFQTAGTGFVLAGAAFNASAADGVPFSVAFAVYGGNTKVTDLQTAVTANVTTAATGTGLTVKGRFYIQGFLMALATLA